MKIITNTAISVDGKISTRINDHVRLGSKHDLIRMDEIRKQADAILIGGNTFRNYPHPLIAPNNLPIWNIILSRSLNLNFDETYLTETKIRPLVFTDKKGTTLPVETFYIEKLSMQDVVSELENRKIKTLLIEAGGKLIFEFLKANLIDEMFVTLCPLIIGGVETPTLADGEGFLKDHIKRLKLLNHEQIGDEIFLHYEVNTLLGRNLPSFIPRKAI